MKKVLQPRGQSNTEIDLISQDGYQYHDQSHPGDFWVSSLYFCLVPMSKLYELINYSC